MKRMKKKVVAMVTLAMFMMTLLPMAAFAAPGAADPQASKFITAKENVSVNVGDDVEKPEHLCTVGGNVNGTVAMEDTPQISKGIST